MMHYSHYGFKDFAVALGYKGECIKKYMVDFCSLNSNLTVDFSSGSVTSHGHHDYDWKMDLIETGLKTQTGGRIKRLALYLGDTSF